MNRSAALLLFALTGMALLVFSIHAAPATENDEAALRLLHEKVLQEHRDSDASLLLADEAGDYTVANRGEINRPSLSQRRERLQSYLGSTRFNSYRDLVEPEVRVSPDGQLGWVVVQVEADGLQTAADGETQKLTFVAAWIELYEKRDGRWLRIGNVSNFKP